MDQWQQHVLLEISDAIGNEDRLLTITNLLFDMEQEGLVPDEIGDKLFNYISFINERSD